MNTAHHRTMAGRPQQEMLQKSRAHDSFFGYKGRGKGRPSSVATEFVDMEWDTEEEVYSEMEDGENSPRLSLNSSGQPSITTLSSYDEVQTPRSSRARGAFTFEVESTKPVEGPRGPHLFRSSMTSSNSLEFQNALSLSPLTPRVSRPTGHLPIALDRSPPRSKSSPFQFTNEELDTAQVVSWTPEMIAQWMLNAGIELSVAERFVENDINGAILVTLKFQDLKELGIQSFGMRTQVWHHIETLRDRREVEPRAPTPIEDEPSKEVRKERRKQDDGELKHHKSKGKKLHQTPSHEDVISPMESVSIVGIEQMMPKPHHCSKGENCSKWRRQQRMLEAFKKDHPFVDLEKGGVIMVAGDPGNPDTAVKLEPSGEFRPISDAMPSVVASSDVMGPGMPPLQYLEEATLRNVQSRDPQDNVRQFLDFQHQDGVGSSEVPPTPPFELHPSHHSPRDGPRSLPKLTIPSQAPRAAPPNPVSAVPSLPCPMERAEALSPDLQTAKAPYRFGTPFSEMDVPVTAVPLGPVARDFSQSVPPNMNFRSPNPPPRTMSRSSARRPSFPLMPALDENLATPVAPRSKQRASPPRPLQPPPRFQYPWSSAEHPTMEKAIAPMSAVGPGPSGWMSPLLGGRATDASGRDITYQGMMKKRKTKMLRHEWHEHYFTLKGTRLAMHKDAGELNRTLEYIDVDDYAIACSSLASSKLNAAFKAVNVALGHKREHSDPVAAFSFQLIPQDKKGGVLLKRRESTAAAGGGGGGGGGDNADEGVNGTGKTHHFAVKNRDDRIDWMRELMLAKALRQKGEGFEVRVNGNMI